jgi:hypothetical protein
MKLPKLVNPIEVTKEAFGLAGSAVGLAEVLAGRTTRVVVSSLHRLNNRGEPSLANEQMDRGATPATGLAGESMAMTDATVPDAEGSAQGPRIISVEPHASDEPPIDVVGQALAAEAALGNRESPEGSGVAHEPRGASRDEEHGHAPWQPAERDAIDEEVSAAFDGDLEPAEHLAQPVLDPSEAKALITEMQTMRRAADRHKG